MKDLDYLHQLSLEMWQNLSMTFFFEKVSLRGRLDIGSQPSGYDETHLPILGNSPWRPLVTLIGFIVVTQINRTYLVANGVNMMMLMCHQGICNLHVDSGCRYQLIVKKAFISHLRGKIT